MSDKKEKKERLQDVKPESNSISADATNVVQEKLPDMTPADPNAVYANIQQKLATNPTTAQIANPVA